MFGELTSVSYVIGSGSGQLVGDLDKFGFSHVQVEFGGLLWGIPTGEISVRGEGKKFQPIR
jgi:hypothetical protein